MDYSKLLDWSPPLSGYAALSGGVNAFGLGGMGAVKRGGFGSSGAIGSVRGVTTGLTTANTALFRAAVQGGARNVPLCILGNSTDRGQTTGGGTGQWANSWPVKLATALQGLGLNAGSNNLFGSGGQWGGASTMAAIEAGDPRVAHTGSWAVGSNVTAGGFNYQCTAAGSMTITPIDQTTNFEFGWRNNTAGRSFNWFIDADSPAQIDSSAVDALVTVKPAAKTKGIHSITFNWVVGTPVIIYVLAYDASGGRKEISVWNWGHCGVNSTQLASTSFGACSVPNCIGTLTPDLALIEGGAINDTAQAIPLATSKANQTALVQKQLLTGNAIMRIPVWSLNNSVPAQLAYNSMMYDVARENGIGVIDITKVSGFTSYADELANGYVSDGTGHLTAAGYAAQAAIIAPIIKWCAT